MPGDMKGAESLCPGRDPAAQVVLDNASLPQSQIEVENATITIETLKKFHVVKPIPQISAQQLIATVVRAAREHGDATSEECRNVADFFAYLFSDEALFLIRDTILFYSSDQSIYERHPGAYVERFPPPPDDDSTEGADVLYNRFTSSIRGAGAYGFLYARGDVIQMEAALKQYELYVRMETEMQQDVEYAEQLRRTAASYRQPTRLRGAEGVSEAATSAITIALTAVCGESASESEFTRCEDGLRHAVYRGARLSMLAEWGRGAWLAIHAGRWVSLLDGVHPRHLEVANSALFGLHADMRGVFRRLTNECFLPISRGEGVTARYGVCKYFRRDELRRATEMSFAELLLEEQ